MDILQQADPEVWQAIQGERQRQQQGLEMIASENYASAAVMAAQGSVLTNKYAEGYPGRRTTADASSSMSPSGWRSSAC